MKYNFLRNKFFWLLIFLTGFQQLSGQPFELYINEFMATNASSFYNEKYDDHSDWIEIFNGSNSDVNLLGFHLTDDSDSIKYRIDIDTVLVAGAYMVFWADGNNESVHTNFNLSRTGEFIGLYDDNGNVLDSISYGVQDTDVSYGRLVNDTQSWAFYDTPTPGYQNHNEYATGKAPNVQFSLQGGYYSGSQSISLFSDSPAAEIYYTFDGTEPELNDFLYTSPITLDTTML